MHVSQRIQLLRPSETLAITAQARALKAQGKDVIVLAAGEPDFPPPDPIREAVAREAREGVTRYGPAAGAQQARQALADHLEQTRGLSYSPDQIMYTNGGKHALYNALVGLLDPGDEVLVLAPYWVSYPAQVELVGGTCRYLLADDSQGFKVTAEQLADSLDGIRCVLFNNPSNPTGAFYDADEVGALTEVCVSRGVPIVSDEVYDAIIYGEGSYLSPAAVSPDSQDATVIIGSLSKTYAMPGWRIGFLAGPLDWVKKVSAFQGQTTHHASALAQAAALAAYTGDQEPVEMMRRAFLERRDFLLAAFDGLEGFEVAVPPQGAFYLFPRVTGLIAALDGVEDDAGVCSWLLDKSGVALVPGSAFGAPGFLRLSYAASMQDLKKAAVRIKEAITTL